MKFSTDSGKIIQVFQNTNQSLSIYIHTCISTMIKTEHLQGKKSSRCSKPPTRHGICTSILDLFIRVPAGMEIWHQQTNMSISISPGATRSVWCTHLCWFTSNVLDEIWSESRFLTYMSGPLVDFFWIEIEEIRQLSVVSLVLTCLHHPWFIVWSPSGDAASVNATEPGNVSEKNPYWQGSRDRIRPNLPSGTQTWQWKMDHL